MLTRTLRWKLRGLALRCVFPSLILSLPAVAAAGGSTVSVAPPNGTDDTASIQAALDACTVQGPGCTVQLQAGTYLSRQLVAYNFQGTFRGVGQDRTSIEVIFPLTVTLEPVGGTPESLCQPNTTTCLWPDLIIFINGDIHVADLSLYELAPPGTATTRWGFAGSSGYIGLFDLLTFTGQHVNAYLDRVHIEGSPDPTNVFGLGFNVVNGVHFTGEFPRSLAPQDWDFLSGSYTVRNSSFKSTYDGVSQDAFVKSTVITIGGSPGTGNHFEGLCSGIDMETLEGSSVEISYNESTGICAAMWVVPWQAPELPFVATSPSQYFIHDNKFFASGQFAEGFYFLDSTYFDDTAAHFIDAAAWNNTVDLQGSLSEGIGMFGTRGILLANTSITGSDQADAIGVHDSTLNTVLHNNVSGFTLDSAQGIAQIFLDNQSNQNLVSCFSHTDTVLNLGSQNVLVGCQLLDPPAASANVSKVHPAATSATTSHTLIHKRNL